jgi:3-hydroxyacyl-[acyl-carrier-protein] dehydratase
MRFTLVDRVTSLEAGKSITAIKNLSMAEEYLADHFPGFPVMPGVLMLETLIQAGAWLMRFTDDFQYSTIILKQARGLKFNNFVTPGKTLEVSLKVHKWEGNLCTLKGTGTVENQSAVNARLTLERFNLRDKTPSLAESDELQIKAMREMFGQIAPQHLTGKSETS